MKHQCDRYSLVGLPGVEFCRKGGARAVYEIMQERAELKRRIEKAKRLMRGSGTPDKVLAALDGEGERKK